MDFKPSDIKALLNRNRSYAAAAAAVLVLLVLSLALLAKYRAAARMVAVKKAELSRFSVLASEYLEKKASADMMARKTRPTEGDESAITEIERIGSRAGVKDLITSIKPLEEKQAEGYVESGFEVKIERVDLNRLVNLLYLIENNRRLLVVREFSMKSRFEDPNLLDISMKIARLSRAK